MYKMERYVYDEETKLTYELNKELVYLPIFNVGDNSKIAIGKYGSVHFKYIMEEHTSYYNHLLLSEKLDSYLKEIDERAKRMISEIVKSLADEYGCDDQLKKYDPILWSKKMLNYHYSAEEVVFKELVYVV